MEHAPERKASFSSGLSLPKPRTSLRSSEWTLKYTTPAATKSVNLMSEWLRMCSTAPQAAMEPCSPSRTHIEMPVRIKPIWLMDEQASVRFKSTEKTASTAPRNIVMTAGTSRRLPQPGTPSKSQQEMPIMPNTPLLVRMPESRALAGAGATGWAFGSQMCNGNMPAFAPKPTRAQTPTV